MADKTNVPELRPRVFELAREQNFAALTVLLPSGHLQTQVMWVDVGEDHLLVTELPRRYSQEITALYHRGDAKVAGG